MIVNTEPRWSDILCLPPTENVFCSTGQGGGVDPTCSTSLGKASRVLHPDATDTDLEHAHHLSKKVDIGDLKRYESYQVEKTGIHRSLLHDKTEPPPHRADAVKTLLTKHISDYTDAAQKDLITVDHHLDQLHQSVAKAVGEDRAAGLDKIGRWFEQKRRTAQEQVSSLDVKLSDQIDRWHEKASQGKSSEKDWRNVLETYQRLASQVDFARQDAQTALGKGQERAQRLVNQAHKEFHQETGLRAFTENKKMSIDSRWSEMLQLLPTENVFCSTGQGGGVDPTCSPGSSSEGNNSNLSVKEIEEKMIQRFRTKRNPMDGGDCGAVTRALQLANPAFKPYAVTTEGPPGYGRGISHLLASSDGGKTFVDGRGVRTRKQVMSAFNSDEPKIVTAEYHIEKGSRVGGYYKAADSPEKFDAAPHFAIVELLGLKLTKNESYFSTCDRDDKGHCLPSGSTSSTTPISSDKKEGSTPSEKARGVLGKTLDKLAAVGAKIGHLEHVAKDWIADKSERSIGKLPPRSQVIVRGILTAGKAVTSTAFATYTAGQAFAERVAKERGLNDEQARRLRGVLATTDIALAKPVIIAGEVAHVAAPILAAIGFIPTATLGYLAYSTARNPLATARAAVGVVRDTYNAVKDRLPKREAKVTPPSTPRPRYAKLGVEGLPARNQRDQQNPWREMIQLNAAPTHSTADKGEETGKSIVSALQQHNFDDWYIAVLSAAMDETQDVSSAIELANEAYHTMPRTILPKEDDDEWLEQHLGGKGSTENQQEDQSSSVSISSRKEDWQPLTDNSILSKIGSLFSKGGGSGGDNCGTGAGGFQPGNECAKGDGSGSKEGGSSGGESKGKDFKDPRESQTVKDILSGKAEHDLHYEQASSRADTALTSILKESGKDGTPKLASKEEIDALGKKGWWVAYRGVGEAKYAEQYKTGELYNGAGSFGNGNYFTYSGWSRSDKDARAGAQMYASQNSSDGKGAVLRVAYPPDAKVVSYEKLKQERNTAVKDLNNQLASGKITRDDHRKLDAVYSDLGRFAALKNYDGIKVGSNGFLVVLNRSKAVVEK